MIKFRILIFLLITIYQGYSQSKLSKIDSLLYIDMSLPNYNKIIDIKNRNSDCIEKFKNFEDSKFLKIYYKTPILKEGNIELRVNNLVVFDSIVTQSPTIDDYQLLAIFDKNQIKQRKIGIHLLIKNEDVEVCSDIDYNVNLSTIILTPRNISKKNQLLEIRLMNYELLNLINIYKCDSDKQRINYYKKKIKRH